MNLLVARSKFSVRFSQDGAYLHQQRCILCFANGAAIIVKTCKFPNGLIRIHTALTKIKHAAEYPRSRSGMAVGRPAQK